jgi:hypothetical protein
MKPLKSLRVALKTKKEKRSQMKSKKASLEL